MVIDFDNVPGPYRFDPRDGELAAIYCRTLLPEPWHRCSYWWGLSSSAGFKAGVRIKLAFWLDRPTLGKELERHLKGCPIDVEHAPGSAADLCGPTDPGGLGRPDQTAHRRRARHPRRGHAARAAGRDRSRRQRLRTRGMAVAT